MLAIEAGADDIITGEEIYEIYTVPSEYSKVRENLEKQGLKILESDIEYIPQNTIKIESEEIESKVRKLIEMLEDLDDVQNVYHNGELDE